MAIGLAPTTANAFLNALCRAVNYTAPLTIWIQLHVGDPGAGGTANPATETSRKQITFGSAATGGAISNTAAVTWTSIAGSQDASHYTLWDASTAGTFLGSGVITAGAYVAGDTYNMAAGAMVFSFSVAA